MILLKTALRIIPRKHLIKLSKYTNKIFYFIYRGNRYECSICGAKLRKFLPYGYGKNFKPNRLCPKCLSLERHRLLWLFIVNETNILKENLLLLHIAPEQAFYYKFKKLNNLKYVTFDLESPLADIKGNILNLPFNDNTFDVIICNHVLEHVEEDTKALKELFRVLKKGGYAIIQVPIDLKREITYENKEIKTKKEREKYFGQKDHVRIYGKDFKTRVQSVGFNINEINYASLLKDDLIYKYNLPKNELIFYCIKP